MGSLSVRVAVPADADAIAGVIRPIQQKEFGI